MLDYTAMKVRTTLREPLRVFAASDNSISSFTSTMMTLLFAVDALTNSLLIPQTAMLLWHRDGLLVRRAGVANQRSLSQAWPSLSILKSVQHFGSKSARFRSDPGEADGFTPGDWIAWC